MWAPLTTNYNPKDPARKIDLKPHVDHPGPQPTFFPNFNYVSHRIEYQSFKIVF